MGYSATYHCGSRAPALALLALAAIATPLHAGEVYKTTDAEGHVVYTDHADPAAPKSSVPVNPFTAKQAARNAKLQAAHQAEDNQRRKQQALEAAKMAKLDHDAKVECDAAQSRFYGLKESAHSFHTDVAGNRVNDTDAEAAMKREAARQAMVLACTD